MADFKRSAPPLSLVLASLLLWVSFAWGLPADGPVAEGETDVAPKDRWAGVRISDAYDYAKCPECGKKNEIRAEACARCGNELRQPSGEYTYPPWVFVAGKGFYREGTAVESAKTRKGIIITGYVLITAGAAILGAALAGETDGENLERYVGGIAGACVAGAGGVVLVLGYATRKDPVYALNPGGAYENGPSHTYARRSPNPDGVALKVEVTLLSF